MHQQRYNGVVRNGHIELEGDVKLPEAARVEVVLMVDEAVGRVATPRLLKPEQVGDFQLVVSSEDSDGDV